MHKYSKHIVDLRGKIPGSHLHGKSNNEIPQHSHDIRVRQHNSHVTPVQNHAPVTNHQSPVNHIVTKQISNREFSAVSSLPSVRRDSFIGSIFSQIKSAMQFAVLTSIIFVILFGLSNFSAYKEILSYWYQTEVIQAEKEYTAVDTVVTPLEEQNVKDIVINKGKVSYINFQVRPSDNRIYIPKINKNLPVVEPSNKNLIAQNWEELEKDIQKSLRAGVVLYPDTAKAGQLGNMFLTSHSSWYPNDPLPLGLGSAFALLSKLVAGDKVYVFDNGEMYIYQVRDKFIVKPTDVSVLDQPTNRREMTLMTCTPVGTTLNRLIVKLDLIYPTYNDDGEEMPNTPSPYLEGRLQA